MISAGREAWPVIPPMNGDFAAAHTVVTVTWPWGWESGWIECPVCCATPSRVEWFTDLVYYDYSFFGRVAIPRTPHGFLEQWLACFATSPDDEWLKALHAFEEEGFVVDRAEHPCPMEV